MKIVISVSDEIFELSEQLAKKLKVSRDKIFEMGVEKLAKSLDNELETGKTNISKKRMTRNRIAFQIKPEQIDKGLRLVLSI